MIDFFRRNNTFHIPVLALLAFILKISFLGFNPALENPDYKKVGGLLDPFIYEILYRKIDSLLVNTVALLILFASAVYLNQILTAKRMFQRSHMLTGLSFLLFTAIFPIGFGLNAGVALLPVTILLYGQMTSLQNAPKPLGVITNIGLICGIASILYHPFWWMLPCSLIVLAQIRAFKWNEWILLTLTFLTPFYFAIAFQFLTDHWNPGLFLPSWNPYYTLVPPDPFWITGIALAVLWVGIGFGRWQSGNGRMLIQARKNWYILLTISIFTLPTLFYPQGNTEEGLSLLAVSVTPFAAHSFGEGKKKWPANLLLFTLLLTAGFMVWKVLGGNA